MQSRTLFTSCITSSQENDIDLSLVEGSGTEGRITRKDLLAIIESGNIPTAAADTAAAVAEAKRPAALQSVQHLHQNSSCNQSMFLYAVGDIEIPVTGVRKAIAANMLRSVNTKRHMLG